MSTLWTMWCCGTRRWASRRCGPTSAASSTPSRSPAQVCPLRLLDVKLTARLMLAAQSLGGLPYTTIMRICAYTTLMCTRSEAKLCPQLCAGINFDNEPEKPVFLPAPTAASCHRWVPLKQRLQRELPSLPSRQRHDLLLE